MGIEAKSGHMSLDSAERDDRDTRWRNDGVGGQHGEREVDAAADEVDSNGR